MGGYSKVTICDRRGDP